MNELVHETVLLKEAVDALNINDIRKDGVYVDGTFGRGGHSREILKRLSPIGRLIAFDKDPEAILSAKQITDERFEIVQESFANLENVLKAKSIPFVDGVLLDLGISSPQVDDEERGFSFKKDGPLDMRMNPAQGMSASDWLSQASEKEIAQVIKEYGEERFAKQIAKAIVLYRQNTPITRTQQLSTIVSNTVKTFEKNKHPATRTFQAIRIFINNELEDLKEGLNQSWRKLAINGRLSVISFHSLEDKQVKTFFSHKSSSLKIDRRIPLKANELPKPAIKVFGKIKPTEQEISANVRARSAILRVGQKLVE